MKMMQIKDQGSVYLYRLDWLLIQIFKFTPPKGKKTASCELTLRFTGPALDLNGQPTMAMEWSGFFDSLESAKASISIVEY